MIGTIKHLSFHLPRKSLLTIYKSFARPHPDYGDIIYDNKENETINKLEKVQYLACLAVTGTFQGRVRAFIENWGLNVYKLGGGIEK